MKDDGIAENAIEVARAMIAKTDTQERYEMSQKFLKKIGASLPQDKKEILGEDSDLINFLEQEPKGMDIDNASAFLQAREAEKKKRIRKSAHDQREELEVDTSEKTNNEILSIGLEGLSKKERHYQAPISFNIRGYLLALYHHLADRKDSKGNFIWPHEVLQKFVRDRDAIAFRQRREPATSSIIRAHRIQQRAPKKYINKHREDGNFRAVPLEEKKTSEAHRSEILSSPPVLSNAPGISHIAREKTMLSLATIPS
jgi:hypothetical protein